jgi:hypothetical protein
MMMGSNNSKKPVWAAMAALIVLGGVTTYALMSPRQIPSDLSKDKPKQVKQLTPKYDKGSLTFEESQAVAPAGTDPMAQVVNDYLDKVPAVPKDAQLLDVKMEGATAVLNFNDAFRAGYGTEDEQIVIQGILSSLAQFSEVQNVLFKINGQPLESIGNIDLSEPQPVTREDSKGSEAPPNDSPEKGG